MRAAVMESLKEGKLAGLSVRRLYVKPFKVSVKTLRLDVIKILPLGSPLDGNLCIRDSSDEVTSWLQFLPRKVNQIVVSLRSRVTFNLGLIRLDNAD